MNIVQAFDMQFATELKVSRPKLLDERNSYLLYQGENKPIMLCRVNSPLRTPWCPTPTDLVAEDWFFVEV